jgi:hypothetical protein
MPIEQLLKAIHAECIKLLALVAVDLRPKVDFRSSCLADLGQDFLKVSISVETRC